MTTTPNKPGRDIGKRLFESGTYKDPRLVYDVNILLNLYFTPFNISRFRVHKKMRKRNDLLKRLYDTNDF